MRIQSVPERGPLQRPVRRIRLHLQEGIQRHKLPEKRRRLLTWVDFNFILIC